MLRWRYRLSATQHQCCFALERASSLINSLQSIYIGNTTELHRIAQLQLEVANMKLDLEQSEEAQSSGVGVEGQRMLLDRQWEECRQQEHALHLLLAAQRNDHDQAHANESELLRQLAELQAKLDAVNFVCTLVFPDAWLTCIARHLYLSYTTLSHQTTLHCAALTDPPTVICSVP